MPDRQRLALGAEQDLLMCDQATQPYAVDSYPVHLGATSPCQLLDRCIRRRREGGCVASSRNSACSMISALS